MATEGKLSGVNSEDDFTEEFNAREDAEMEETFLHFNNIYSQQQQNLPNSGISQQKSDSQQRTSQDMKSILVNEMQEYQCIWNNRVKGYKDLNKKAQAWKELSLKTRVNGIYNFIILQSKFFLFLHFTCLCFQYLQSASKVTT